MATVTRRVISWAMCVNDRTKLTQGTVGIMLKHGIMPFKNKARLELCFVRYFDHTKIRIGSSASLEK